MNEYTFKLSYEQVDQIVVGQLAQTLDCLKSDLGNNRGVFVWGDPDADDVEIQKRIDALVLLLDWYATPDQLKDMGLEP